MPYTPKGYTDQDAIEAWLGEDLDAGADVDAAIAAAEAIIDTETGRDFGTAGEDPEPGDRVFDGDGTGTLYIGQATDITAVKLSPDGDAIDDDQYYLYPANQDVKDRIKMRYLKFPVGMQNIVITATWGGEQVPADIHLAATMLAAGILQNSVPTSEEVQSMTVGRYSVTYKTAGVQAGAAAKVQDILDLHKRYTF